MSNCVFENCQEEANYICFCDSNLELICNDHFKDHINLPMHHSIFNIDKVNTPETCSYLYSVLKTSIKGLKSIKLTIQGYIKSMKACIKSSEIILEQLNEVQEYCKSYFYFLTEKMNLPNSKKVKVDLHDYAKTNIIAFTCIQKKNLEKIFTEIDGNLELQPVQKLDLSYCKDFIDIITKISRPVIEIKNSHMQADPFFYIFENQKILNFFDAKYKNFDYTLKIYEDTQFNFNQIETHKRLSKNDPNFLKVILSFKSKSKLMVLTEKYSHTILNEVHTRSCDKAFYKVENILPLFTSVLKIFEKESEYKHITPNMIHVTPSGLYKIWYPENLEEKSEVFTYLSPEVYSWKTNKESFEYESMSAKGHNLYCIGLVFLQIMSLEDTSKMYTEENKQKLQKIIMKLKESAFRKSIIGILIKSIKLRLTFKKIFEIMDKLD